MSFVRKSLSSGLRPSEVNQTTRKELRRKIRSRHVHRLEGDGWGGGSAADFVFACSLRHSELLSELETLLNEPALTLSRPMGTRDGEAGNEQEAGKEKAGKDPAVLALIDSLKSQSRGR